jgi:hydrogenase maturation factor
MIAVVAPEAAQLTIDALAADGVAAAVVGEVVEAEAIGGARYQEAVLTGFAA